MPQYVNITKFAERVERLCDFVLDKLKDETGRRSEDINVIKDLKEDAANIQFNRSGSASETFTGLHDYMQGIPSVEETKE